VRTILKKELVVTTSLPPNILSHIYASAGLTGNSEYCSRFRHTLRVEDIDFLKPLQQNFMPSPPATGGPLFLFMYQFPSYFPAEDLKGTIKNFDLLLGGLDTRTPLSIWQGIDPETVKVLQTWIPPEVTEASWGQLKPMLGELRGILERLKEIMSYAYRSFYKGYWETRESALLEKAGEIQDKIGEFAIFDAWSEALKMPFPYKEFVVYLCDPGFDTSLLAEKIAMPYSTTIERTLEIIVHEVGVHFISPQGYLQQGVAPDFFLKEQEKFMRMEEASICYFKPQVCSRLGLSLDSDYIISLMKIEKEVQRFKEVWETERPDNLYDGILCACNLS